MLIVPAEAGADSAPVVDLPPRLAPVAADLNENDLVKDPNTGQIWFRFTGSPGNWGTGPLYVVGRRDSASPATVDINDDTMPAYQRIYRSDGSYAISLPRTRRRCFVLRGIDRPTALPRDTPPLPLHRRGSVSAHRSERKHHP